MTSEERGQSEEAGGLFDGLNLADLGKATAQIGMKLYGEVN